MAPGRYQDPEIYDRLHAPTVPATLAVLDGIAHRYRPPALPWLEPACGTGRLIGPRGGHAIGFDREAAMVRFARSRYPKGRWFVADLTRFASEIGADRIGFSFCLDNTIRHLEPDGLALHLGELAQVLARGAVAVIGISLASGEEIIEEDVFRSESVMEVVTAIPPGPGERHEQILSELTIHHPGGETEHRSAQQQLRCYGRTEFLDLVGASPLELQGWLDWYGEEWAIPESGYGLAVLGPRG